MLAAMDRTLNVDRYLTDRLRIAARLRDAGVPGVAAERWVVAWEDEAERRGLDPWDREWWRSGRAWIAQACGGSDTRDRSLPEAVRSAVLGPSPSPGTLIGDDASQPAPVRGSPAPSVSAPALTRSLVPSPS